MNKEFVTYEQALVLKELGFDEECLGYYIELANPIEGIITIEQCDKNVDGCLAPLKQQVFRWVREKGYKPNIVNDVSASKDGFYYFDIWLSGQILWETDYIYNTYEEAEDSCIDKLIELLKQKP